MASRDDGGPGCRHAVMNGSIAEQKAALRRELRTVLRGFPPEQRAEASRRLCAVARESAPWQAARAILFYSPLAEEPDLGPLLGEALAAGRVAGLPRFDPLTGAYLPRQVRRWPEDLEPGRFGVLEPVGDCPALDVKHLDLVLVPGIGFTLDGARLGRGKGYYDRLLSQVCGFKCGVAFECQLVTVLPVEPHDIRLNGILTPSAWRCVSSQDRVMK